MTEKVKQETQMIEVKTKLGYCSQIHVKDRRFGHSHNYDAFTWIDFYKRDGRSYAIQISLADFAPKVPIKPSRSDQPARDRYDEQKRLYKKNTALYKKLAKTMQQTKLADSGYVASKGRTIQHNNIKPVNIEVKYYLMVDELEFNANNSRSIDRPSDIVSTNYAREPTFRTNSEQQIDEVMRICKANIAAQQLKNAQEAQAYRKREADISQQIAKVSRNR